MRDTFCVPHGSAALHKKHSNICLNKLKRALGAIANALAALNAKRLVNLRQSIIILLANCVLRAHRNRRAAVVLRAFSRVNNKLFHVNTNPFCLAGNNAF